jgi:Ca2+-binding RTX toxin-like protein
VNDSPKLLALGLAATAITVAITPGAGAVEPRCHGETVDVTGTPGADRVNTAELPQMESPIVLDLLGGDDRLHVEDSVRVVACAGLGDDAVTFSPESDGVADGGRGADRLTQSGDLTNMEGHGTRLIGKAGRDRLRGIAMSKKGGPGDDRLVGLGRSMGGGGDDRVLGSGEGADRLYGNRGDDVLKGYGDPIYPATDRAFGGAGEDRCEAEITKGCE